MFSPEMPPLVDMPPVPDVPFIPPPSNGVNYWPAQGNHYPPFVQQPQQPPPQGSMPCWAGDPSVSASAPPGSTWQYGYPVTSTTPVWPTPPNQTHPLQASYTPVWGQTPATSPWGAPNPGQPTTPGGTWGAHSPASHGAPHTPYGGSSPYTHHAAPTSAFPGWPGAQQQQTYPPAAPPISAPAAFGGDPWAGAWPSNGTTSPWGQQQQQQQQQWLTPPKKQHHKRRVSMKEGDAAAYAQLRRSNSQGASPHRKASNMNRSVSFGGAVVGGGIGGGPSTPYPAYAQGDTFDEQNLARRPRDWRPDYNPHPGLGSYISQLGKNKSDVKEYTDPVRRTLHPLLLHTSPTSPPIYYDLREPPEAPESITFLNLNRPPNDIDYAQLALQPSCPFMRLYHPKLPWYVDVYQSHPNGVTVWDVVSTLHRQLSTSISGRHYWNDVMTAEDRALIASAFGDRCRGDMGTVKRGVVQLDYLGKKCVFEGLSRGPRGMWEIKLGKWGSL